VLFDRPEPQGISLLKDEYDGAVTFAHCACGRFLKTGIAGRRNAARRRQLDY